MHLEGVGAKQRTSKLGRRMLLPAALFGVASGLLASEYHGTIRSGGLPVPGVSVTATQGDKRALTTTDEKGAFRFTDLADGVWTIQVEMTGFESITREVGVSADAPSPGWELKFLKDEAPGAPRGLAAAPPAGNFRRLNLSQSADAGTTSTEGALKTDEVADLTQSSANSFLVQGSVSSAAGMAQQNDWMMGPPGGRGMGGPPGEGMPGAGGPGNDGHGVASLDGMSERSMGRRSEAAVRSALASATAHNPSSASTYGRSPVRTTRTNSSSWARSGSTLTTGISATSPVNVVA